MNSYKALLIVCISILITAVSTHGDAHRCGHDDEEINPEFLHIDEDMSTLSEGRILASASYPQFRIAADYSYLNSAPVAYKAYIQNELAPPAISWFQAALQVKYPVSGLLKVGSTVTQTCGFATPAALFAGVKADFFIFFNSRVEDSNTVASSKYCFLAGGTKRPLIATTNFNRNILRQANGDVLIHEKNTYLLIHEMMHNLGFSDNSYQFFLDEKGKTRTGHIKSVKLDGKTSKVIDVAPLTDRLRAFYGCPSIPGAYLENDGGSGTTGSHFERKMFVYETMSSGDIFGRKISQFSLALLEGSGWYIPNYNYSEPYFFGQGQGCDFITGSCTSSNYTFDEFCKGTGRGCSAIGTGGGKCFADPRADGCKYVLPDEDYLCENADAVDFTRLAELQVYGRGAGSKCFTGDLNTRVSNNGRSSFCFTYNCTGQGVDTQLTIQVGNNELNCTQAGQVTLDGFYGSIDCPDPIAFCSTIGQKYCPRNCMGRGTCVDSVCQCNTGFSGIDCGLQI